MSDHPRVHRLNGNREYREGPILYWMQSSVRTRSNHALEYAIHNANRTGREVVVLFVLDPGYPDANVRHFSFLLDGLADAAEGLQERGVGLRVAIGCPTEVVPLVAQKSAAVVTDRGYLKHLRRWRREIADTVTCPVIEVESNIVVPVETASEKLQYSAATLRPRIHRQWTEFLYRPERVTYQGGRVPDRWWPDGVSFLDLSQMADREQFFDRHKIDRTVAVVEGTRGGQNAASGRLGAFIAHHLEGYAEGRNDPAADIGTHLSAYLHFGQISPIEIATSVIEHDGASSPNAAGDDAAALLEELIVRRELAINFCHYSDSYDEYSALPDWAARTLDEHRSDEREYTYDRATLEAGETHDPYWNAAQLQMVRSGRMHNYMRMYWGKKILEWSTTPEGAFDTALFLNDRYELDGRDPNGYAGVAWCFGKHDRPWTERPIFGKVRYMNDNGLRRKFKRIDEYVARWS